MNWWHRWMRRPQSVWLRKAIFQIHLWTGIGLDLYILAISISGSAIVFRNDVYKSVTTRSKTVPISGRRLTRDELRKAVKKAWPQYNLSFIWDGKRPTDATEVWMDHHGKRKERLFNPYTGQDLGDSVPLSIHILAWMADLHTNLLGGDTGRTINGIASILLTLLAITGLVIWWPGVANWRRSLIFNPKSNWKRLNWDLHSAAGFWTFAFLFVWAVTGVFLVFPRPFQLLVNHFSPLIQYRLDPLPETSAPAQPRQVVTIIAGPGDDGKITVITGDGANQNPTPRRRRLPPIRRSTGDKVLRWLYSLHFGNFAGWKVKTIWTVLGLAPPFLFITGLLMWWNRVLSPEARRARRRAELTAVQTTLAAGD